MKLETWDDLPAGCFLEERYLKLDIFKWHISFLVEGLELSGFSGMHGRGRFNYEGWEPISFIPPELFL